MPNPDNEPQIPKNQSPITDDRTGMVARDWYRFFLNLLNKANTAGGSGTVTSVNVSGGTTGLTTSGGPVTTSGTITLAGTLDVDNGGTGATTAAGARTNLSVPSTTGSGASGTWAIDITGNAANVTGTVAIANGGTGATTAATARTNLSAAQSGANTDITSIALTTGTISAAPSGNSDIVNKYYADSLISGVNFHAACNYATTAALSPANTYNNGASGVGATLTANSNGTLTIDGYTFVTADIGKRILVKNEAAGANNGVYTLTQEGSASQPYILTRATDYDTAGTGANSIDQGDLMLVLSGTANANTSWVQQTALPITVGTTAIVFVQFAAVQTYSAGTGLTLSSNTFSITNTGTAGTYGSASAVPVFVTNAQGQVTSVTNTSIAIAGSAVSGNISGNAANVTGTVAVANGGTGQTTYTDGQLLIGNSTGNTLTKATLTASTGISITNGTGSITIANSLPMTYPGAGIPNSTGTAWGTSYSTTGSGTVVALATSPSFTTPILGTPQSGNFSTGTFTWPTFNQNTTGTASNVTGTVAILNGGTGQTTASAAFNALSPVTSTGDLILGNGVNSSTRLPIGANTYVLTSNGTTASWALPTGSGATITNDTTTATNVYPTFAAATSGSLSTIYTSNAKLLYKPSTGELTSTAVAASNGIFVNSLTIGTSYTIPAGYSGMSAGTVTVSGGVTVTVPSGSRWVVV
jgi:hypothetical protein